jgi:hypothetical protein
MAAGATRVLGHATAKGVGERGSGENCPCPMPHAPCPMPGALAEESRQRGHIVKILRILPIAAIQSDKLLSVDL